MNAPTEQATIVAELTRMLGLSEALRAKLLAENNALKGDKSPLFNPRGPTLEVRQLEREAFAAGLHFAAASRSAA